jgi:hypothetical protein
MFALVRKTPSRRKAITAALDQAEAAAKFAEAQIAKALGYDLCKCQFPPTPMLTVGYFRKPVARYVNTQARGT